MSNQEMSTPALPERIPIRQKGKQGMSVEQRWWYAGLLKNSVLTPTHLRGKQDDIFIILNFAAELGISDLGALHGITIINGKPHIYGDLLVALMIMHPDFEDFWFDFEMHKTEGLICTCTGKRKNRKAFTGKFSEVDAKKAGLSEKTVWKQYGKQMLMRRALNQVVHYLYPDALYGGQPEIDSPYGKDGYVIDDASVDNIVEPESATQPNKRKVTKQVTKPKPVEIPNTVYQVPNERDTRTGIISKKSLLSILGELNEGKRNILDAYETVETAYDEIINSPMSSENENEGDIKYNPHDGFNSALALLTIVLMEYLNSTKVTTGVNNFLKREYPSRFDSSPPTMEELANYPDTCKKMINRIITTFIPQRIALCKAIQDRAKALSISDNEVLMQIPYVSNKLGNSEWGQLKQVKIQPTAIQIMAELTANNDYGTIPLEDLESLNPDLVLAPKINRIPPENATTLGIAVKDCGAELIEVIAPFAKFPDLRMVDIEHIDNVKKYAYLLTLKGQNTAYLTTEELHGFKEYLKTLDFGTHAQAENISITATGIFHVPISEIPKVLLANTKQYQDFTNLHGVSHE